MLEGGWLILTNNLISISAGYSILVIESVVCAEIIVDNTFVLYVIMTLIVYTPDCLCV